MPLLSDCSITINIIMDTRRCLITMVTSRIGYQIASQAEIHGLRLLVVPELEVLIQLLELIARDSPKSKAELNMMAIVRLGLTIALQEEIHLNRQMAVPELEVLTQVLESSARDSIRRSHIAWLSMMETNKTGLINVTQIKTLWLRRTQVELVLTRMRRLVVLSQESV